MISSALILCVIALGSFGASGVHSKFDIRGKIPLNELGQEISAPPAAISIIAEDVAWDAGGVIKISWQPAAGTTSATKWIVERSEVLAAGQGAGQAAGQGPWTLVAEVPIAETSAVASKLSPDASFFFRVTAVSPNGSSAVTTTKSAAKGHWNFFISAKFPLFCAI